MEQAVFTDKKVCNIIGSPDFNCNVCRRCRENADPIYKQCLTLRITGDAATDKSQLPCQKEGTPYDSSIQSEQQTVLR